MVPLKDCCVTQGMGKDKIWLGEAHGAGAALFWNKNPGSGSWR